MYCPPSVIRKQRLLIKKMLTTIKNKCGTKEKAYSQFKRCLSLAKSVSDALPNKKDSVFKKGVKYISVAELLYYEFFPKKAEDPYYDYVSGLCGKWTSPGDTLLKLVFNTDLSDVFSVKQEQLNFSDKSRKVIAWKIFNKEIGTIIFFKDNQYEGGIFTHVFQENNFKMNLFLDVIWSKYNNKIHVENVYDHLLKTNAKNVSALSHNAINLTGNSKNRLDLFIARHNRYVEDKIPRTYLFNGPPGSGKSTFAVHFAVASNKKVLRLDATIVSRLNAVEMDFLLDGLRPDIIVIDDIDRVGGLSDASPTLFSIFTDFKDKHPRVTIILTTNNKHKLPDALLRPGRIDEIIEFEHLDFDPRKEIFNSYINHYNVENCGYLDEVVEQSVGLTAAYIKEIVIQMKYRDKDEVLQLVSRMKEIAGVKKE